MEGVGINIALPGVEADDLSRTIIIPPGSFYIDRLLPGPWLTVLGAARWLGNPCVNGRAPNSVYEILHEIGGKFHGRLIVHSEDLDAYVREQIGRPEA